MNTHTQTEIFSSEIEHKTKDPLFFTICTFLNYAQLIEIYDARCVIKICTKIRVKAYKYPPSKRRFCIHIYLCEIAWIWFCKCHLEHRPKSQTERGCLPISTAPVRLLPTARGPKILISPFFVSGLQSFLTNFLFLFLLLLDVICRQLHIAIMHQMDMYIISEVIKMAPAPWLLELKNDIGAAPIHFAVLTGQSNVVRRLLIAGAKVSQTKSCYIFFRSFFYILDFHTESYFAE